MLLQGLCVCKVGSCKPFVLFLETKEFHTKLDRKQGL